MCLLRLDRMEKPYLDPDIHPMDVLLYRARAEDMDTVIIAREVLLRRGAHTRVDKGDVLKQLRDHFSAPVDRQVLEARQMIDWLLPYVERFYQSWSPDPGTPITYLTAAPDGRPVKGSRLTHHPSEKGQSVSPGDLANVCVGVTPANKPPHDVFTIGGRLQPVQVRDG